MYVFLTMLFIGRYITIYNYIIRFGRSVIYTYIITETAKYGITLFGQNIIT